LHKAWKYFSAQDVMFWVGKFLNTTLVVRKKNDYRPLY